MNYKKQLAKEFIKEKSKGKKLIFPEQKYVGQQIVQSFQQKILVTLCAPPQWGKTGVSLFVSYKMSLHNTRDVFYLTGMSDKNWVEQTKDRLLPSWKENVYHRNTLHIFLDRLEKLKSEKKDKNLLIIIDECHIANKSDNLLSDIMKQLYDSNIKKLIKRKIKILQISATPSNALIDAELWEKYHQKITPIINTGYVSFQSFISKEKLKSPFELSDLSQVERFMYYFNNFPNPRYHFIRASSKGPSGKYNYYRIKANLSLICENKSYELIEMNGTIDKSIVNDIFKSLSKQPKSHTIILIKDMLGAAKTIDDTYIGCVHESTPDKKDFSSEVQGLPGRLCGWTKQRGKYSPIIFCNREIIESYILLYQNNFNFNDIEITSWKDSKVRINRKGEVVSKKSYLQLNE